MLASSPRVESRRKWSTGLRISGRAFNKTSNLRIIYISFFCFVRLSLKVLKETLCSNLQENNVALFLRIVEKEINKKHNKNIYFGPRKEQALSNFENFFAVLKGMSELSMYFEKKTKVKGFKIENKKNRTPEKEEDIEPDFNFNDHDDYYDYDESQG